MPNVELTRDGPVSVPLNYPVPNGGELAPLTVSATIDGTSAATPFYAVVQVLDPNGRSMGKYVSSSIAAGASADVTWFPRVTSAATAGTTGAGMVTIFDKTLTGTASLFTTGSGGIPTTSRDLLIVTTLRTSEAIESTFDCQVNFNNDFAGTYKDGRIKMVNTTITGQIDSPGGLACMSAAGNTADADVFAPNFLYIPNYQRAGDHFAIGMQGVNSKAGSSTNWNLGLGVHTYVGVGLPISRVDVSPNVGGGAQFVSGSRCTIYGVS